MSDSFRTIALLAAYNEGDIISSVIGHLIENGIEVYLLDNHSTDDTVKEAQRWLGRGLIEIETFPASPDDPVYGRAGREFSLATILRREEELAQMLTADWFLHHDADEIRESPWPDVPLREAIHFVDSAGYNCIDFRVVNFPPVDDGFRRGLDPRSYFTRYEEAGALDRPQMKAWKARSAPVVLARTGGHEAEFEGRRVFPIPFLLRHYPIRGQEHGRRKVFLDRRPRFAADERARQWHIQYDGVRGEGHSFLRDQRSLRPFDLARIRLDLMLAGTGSEAHASDLACLLEDRDARIADLERRHWETESLLTEARGKVARIEALRESLEREVERLALDRNAVLGSKTWRWTALVRRLLDALKRQR